MHRVRAVGDSAGHGREAPGVRPDFQFVGGEQQFERRASGRRGPGGRHHPFRMVRAPGPHRQVRFRWGLGPHDAEPLIIGFDVVIVDDDGRIADVRGFLDKVPG